MLLMGLCFSAARGAGPEEEITLGNYLKRAGYSQIQLELDRDNHLFVRGILRGKKQRFVLDTGSGVTRLDPKLARGLDKFDGSKLKPEDASLNGAPVSGLVVMDELELGGLNFLDQPAQVGAVASGLARVAENGLLGCDFFYRNHCIIDCVHARLYVRSNALPADLESDLAAILHQSGFTETRIRQKPGLPGTCKAKLNGEELELILDTASPWTVLDWDCGRRLKLPVMEKPAHLDFSGIRKPGAHGLQEAQAQTLQLGGATLKRAYVALADLSAWEAAVPGKTMPEALGRLGVETLATAGALLDFGTSKLWLNPPAPR